MRNLLCKVCFLKMTQDNINLLVTVLLQDKWLDIATHPTFYLCCNWMYWILIDLMALFWFCKNWVLFHLERNAGMVFL